MDTLSLNFNGVPASSYDVLAFERKLVELVEELRLRRNLEIESENNLKSLLDEKYKSELEWDERQSRYVREKAELEQQISLLKRKLDQKFCVSDDEKTKQQIVGKTYSQEIRALKEELRNSNSEKLNLLKRIQELEGQLKLHTSFQETIVSQIGDIRKRTRALTDECQALEKAHKNVLDNVSEAKNGFKKFDISNQHLLQCIAVAERNSEALKKELITTRAEIILLKNANVSANKSPETSSDANQLQLRISELSNLLLLSRKENQKTLQNFVESNKQLNKYINKYENAQEVEKSLNTKLRDYDMKLQTAQCQLNELLDELKSLKENSAIENQRKENRKTVETQTHDESIEQCCTSYQENSHMYDQLATHSKNETPCPLGTLLNSTVTITHTKTKNFPKQTLEVSHIDTAQPLQCISSFQMDDEIGIFGETVKRKFDTIGDEDEDAMPLKKRMVETMAIETGTHWEINKQRYVDPDTSIQSSANSISDFVCQSQDISVADGNINKDSMLITGETAEDENKETEGETSDLASVQLNLKELKMNDACGGLSQEL